MLAKLESLNRIIVQCRQCPRLTIWREEVARVKRKAYRDEEYWGNPVPGFGDIHAKVLVVGLAPGAHGSNRTGRMFTGDSSGDILYRNLHGVGFANKPISTDKNDGLLLKRLYISAVCRCVPPGNKPLPEEISNCLPFLSREVELLTELIGVVTLGRIAYQGVARIFKEKGLALPNNDFHHGNFIKPTGSKIWILQSYHPSRQNTQTGRLTESMFSEIWSETRRLLDDSFENTANNSH
jgi:uracil-DNA glycosylase